MSCPTILIREEWEESRRDDHPENIQAVHFRCNGEKGSTRDIKASELHLPNRDHC